MGPYHILIQINTFLMSFIPGEFPVLPLMITCICAATYIVNLLAIYIVYTFVALITWSCSLGLYMLQQESTFATWYAMTITSTSTIAIHRGDHFKKATSVNQLTKVIILM